MTTVGYGDLYPITTPGWLVGIVTQMAGTVILSLPITVIGATFSEECLGHPVTFELLALLIEQLVIVLCQPLGVELSGCHLVQRCAIDLIKVWKIVIESKIFQEDLHLCDAREVRASVSMPPPGLS